MTILGPDAPTVRVRVLRVPPSAMLEGFDLRPYGFRKGHAYEVSQPLGAVLILWGYAAVDEPRQAERPRDPSDR